MGVERAIGFIGSTMWECLHGGVCGKNSTQPGPRSGSGKKPHISAARAYRAYSALRFYAKTKSWDICTSGAGLLKLTPPRLALFHIHIMVVCKYQTLLRR